MGSVLKTRTYRERPPTRTETRGAMRTPSTESSQHGRETDKWIRGQPAKSFAKQAPHHHSSGLYPRQTGRAARESSLYTDTELPGPAQMGNEGAIASPVQSDHATRPCGLPTQKSCTRQRGTRRWARGELRYSPIVGPPSHGNQECDDVTRTIRLRHKALRPPDVKIIYLATWDTVMGPRIVPL